MNPIVGIGELLWDVYPDGRKVAGGAPFNFAFHCHQLGHPAVIVSRVGDDELGRELRDEVRRLGLSDEYIQTDPDHPTGTVRVTLDEHKVPTYSITENVAWDHIAYTGQLVLLMEFAAAACFGTLAQRSADSTSTIQEFLTHTAGRPRVFDVNLRGPVASEVLQRSLKRADWLKFNDAEVDALARGGPPELCKAFQLFPLQLWSKCLPQLILVTRGGQGCEVWSTEEREYHFTAPGVAVRVVDTVGAGDAFTAAMVCLHLEGRPVRECIRFANHYAARVCEHQGATPRINRADVERAAFGNGG